MIFQDNIIKNLLKNVYFLTGTPCGGKTTVSRALGKKYNIPVYDIDEMFPYHQKLSNKEHQPAMNKSFKNADEFFGRSVEEYKNWLIQNTREQLDFVLMDLIQLSRNGMILCDCHLTMEEAEKITEPSRIVFLVKEPGALVDDYCNRPDHQGFSHFIHSATDFEKAKAICNETLYSLNKEHYEAIKKSSYFWLDREANRSVEETVSLVEKHFGWQLLEGLRIEKVEKNTQLAEKLLGFIDSCSWTEVKQHLTDMVKNWVFTDWEAMFAAILDDKIVGITSIMKTDYYPMPEIYPWISCVFVSEEYRGHRISEKLIAFANRYAEENGFKRSFIPSEHVGLYEHYGYRYLQDITNYGGGTDHLFVKDIVIS